MKKILLAVPTYENIYPDTFKSIYELEVPEGYSLQFEFVRGYGVVGARNAIINKGLELKADYIFMVDSDVVLPKDALVNLLEIDNDVVLGYYAHRSLNNIYNGNTCICKLKKPDGTMYFNYPMESEYKEDEMVDLRKAGFHRVRIHGGGMGCALFKPDIFPRLKYPWFNWIIYSDGHGTLSEDLYFCEQCKNAGIHMYVDTRVNCGHTFRYIQGVK